MAATENLSRDSAKRSDQELKDEEMELFTKYYLEWKGGRKNDNAPYMNIPRFYYREPFPNVMAEQQGKSKPSGRAPRGPTWSDEETRVLLGHWNTLLIQRRVQNMPTNSDLYAVLAKKMAEEGFLRTRIQCNNRIRDLHKAYRKAKDAMGKAGAIPVRCRFFRELDEICGGETEAVPSSMSQTMRLQPSTTMVQPGSSWEPIPEISWTVEDDSETEAVFDGTHDATQPLQEVLNIKVESELEEAAVFQLPSEPISSSSSSTVAIAPALEEEQQSAFQEPGILIPALSAAAQAPQLLCPTYHSEERRKAGVQDKTAIGRSRRDSEAVLRPPVPAMDRLAQMSARRRRAREETIDRLLEEIRTGREAMDATFRLFLEQQRSFQNSLIWEMRLARQEQRRAAEAEHRARQEEWQQQRTQHILDANRMDAEIIRFRQELNLLRHNFMDFSAARSFPTASQLRTTSPVLAHMESPGPSGSHWEGCTPRATELQALLPDPRVLGVPSRGRRGRPRKRGGVTRKQIRRE
ncbi:serine/threonine-protein phosphatase 2A regulatory subunit B'' subunit gamma isoform X3 [Rhineura floridana]|uniref:serine/threonine-protein phosphatase 2A regulatory subunit B'' subunit gamma isoform X3 n=1 Tax=Rhineura floridana TaxID=261503 RepID=UPI002AC82FBF|nr:serine/threonine-protein phosphatase 2A regulatory subunit B'' subunit gamma isoform X3 [Rhineura floridana]